MMHGHTNIKKIYISCILSVFGLLIRPTSHMTFGGVTLMLFLLGFFFEKTIPVSNQCDPSLGVSQLHNFRKFKGANSV